MSDGHAAIAKAHQSDISMPMHLVIPNTPEAKRLIGMMNKNLPAFLFHMLKEQGLPNKFLNELPQKSCEATMLTDMHCCKWDATNRVITTKDELARVEKTKAFEGAAWFRDEFGLLGQNAHSQKNVYSP